MPFGFMQHRATREFLSVCGQQVRVKNTFLDDVFADKIEEAAEISAERAAQTCPDALLHTSCLEASQSEAEEQQGENIGDDTLATLEWTLHMHMGLSPVPMSTCMDTLSPMDDAKHLSSARMNVVASFEEKDSSIHIDVVEQLHGTDCSHAHKMLSVMQPPVLSTMPLSSPPSDRAGWVPPAPAIPAPAFPPPAEPPRLCSLGGIETAHFESFNSAAEHVESMPNCAEDSDSDSKAKLGKSSPPEQLICRKVRRANKKKRQQPKTWCYFFIDPVMCRPGFQLSKKVIGHGGNNTRRIFEQTAAKIRLRGQGSGHQEASGREAPVHLMLAVTSDIGQKMSFLAALQMSAELLEQVTSQYKEFCHYSNLAFPVAPLFWIGEFSDKAGEYMGLSVAQTAVTLGDLQVSLLQDSPANGKYSRPRQW